MPSVRIPMPVYFAAVAFTLLLIEPELGSSASYMAMPYASASISPMQPDTGQWLGHRAASRQWRAAKPASLDGAGAPSPLR